MNAFASGVFIAIHHGVPLEWAIVGQGPCGHEAQECHTLRPKSKAKLKVRPFCAAQLAGSNLHSVIAPFVKEDATSHFEGSPLPPSSDVGRENPS